VIRSPSNAKYADGADLVIEVLSKDRDRDLQMKRLEYAQAGIPEYWIGDPRDQRITVLRLAGAPVSHPVNSRPAIGPLPRGWRGLR
jgi:Uma2 family endonuclease